MNPSIIRSLSLVLLTASLVILVTGCSYKLDIPLPDEPSSEVPPVLTFEQPYAGLLYTAVDDIDPNLPGIQLHTRIVVEDVANNIWLEDISMTIDSRQRTLLVEDDGNGRRVAETVLTFAAPKRATPVSVRVDGPMSEANAVVSFTISERDRVDQ